MPNDTTGTLETPPGLGRVLGSYGGRAPGSLLVVLSGIHGNERRGVDAARDVLARLERDGPPLRGEVRFLLGNLAALRREVRYVDVDLNRQWTEERVAGLEAENPDPGEPVERREQRELMTQLGAALRATHRPLYFIDLHTSSAEGPPFLTVGDTLPNRRFAAGFPLPLILGLEEQVDGALLEFLNDRGAITLGVEAGGHGSPNARQCHESVLWLALVNAGLLNPADLVDLEAHRERLRAASESLPRVVEIRRRHPIARGDGFRMEKGFRNFDRVRRGKRLASDRSGPVLAKQTGILLLPLYQGLGEEGFFLGCEVSKLGLRASAAARRLRLGAALRWLPGVRPIGDGRSLHVSTRAARRFLGLLRFFGYRKVRRRGAAFVAIRRRFDGRPPHRVSTE